ncbi:hypothetical protein JZ751_029084 [Albula glossodonta]|uniref:Uncharacterized protein n=1 Tax=Albula glossodonta TaxID=121402 RepID=A0A8T2PIT4_9TELE|nr:hypothetical protein JZ751_029084 [Albula glossodonta]
METQIHPSPPCVSPAPISAQPQITETLNNFAQQLCSFGRSLYFVKRCLKCDLCTLCSPSAL